ncbi:putative proline-specific permease put4 [Talaromyces pinophilus]|nr:putative proline-specific permease put4 [Talaromyces pinophilus]
MTTPAVQRIPYSAPREEFINALKKDGCVIVQNFTDPKTLEQARLEVEPWLNKDDNTIPKWEHLLISNIALNGGTQTCTRLIGRSKTVREKFLSDPLYQDLGEEFLGITTTNWYNEEPSTNTTHPLLSIAITMDARPGAQAQKLHRMTSLDADDGERGRPHISVPWLARPPSVASRHAQMLALGETIGTTLFASTGQTLAKGGPAFLLGTFLFMSVVVYTVVTALTEIATWMPVSGSSVSYYVNRVVSPSFGSATRWLYVHCPGILAPYEVTAASLVISYWHSTINIRVWTTVMIVAVWSYSLAVVQIKIDSGSGTGIIRELRMIDGNTGRFIALLATLVISSLPFTFAPEFLILTTGEMAAPPQTLPKGARRYIYRILFFYISVLAIGVICPSNDPDLTFAAGASPFVVAIKNAGVPVLDSVINTGILVSAWSSGNCFFYMATRSLYSQALTGNAPSWFLACTKGGIPYRCVMAIALFCPLAYLSLGSSSTVAFNWFINFTNPSGFISWTCCCIVHLHFCKACKAQNITNLPYSSELQTWES